MQESRGFAPMRGPRDPPRTCRFQWSRVSLVGFKHPPLGRARSDVGQSQRPGDPRSARRAHLSRAVARRSCDVSPDPRLRSRTARAPCAARPTRAIWVALPWAIAIRRSSAACSQRESADAAITTTCPALVPLLGHGLEFAHRYPPNCPAVAAPSGDVDGAPPAPAREGHFGQRPLGLGGARVGHRLQVMFRAEALAASTPGARRAFSWLTPGAGSTSTTRSIGSVNVPVLSMQLVSTEASDSIWPGTQHPADSPARCSHRSGWCANVLVRQRPPAGEQPTPRSNQSSRRRRRDPLRVQRRWCQRHAVNAPEA